MISAKTQNDVNAALRSNDMGLAMSLAEEAVARGESNETLLCLAAMQRQAVGDNLGAVALYQRAVAMAPQNPGILAATGDALRHLGKLTDAITLFDRAIQRDPASVAAWFGRALAQEAEGALEEAECSYARVTELAPDTASGFAGLASIQALRGDIDPARKNAAQALARGPNECSTLMALARCEMAEGHHQKAIGWLSPLLQLPTLAVEEEILAHGLLGESFDKLGLVDEAFDSYLRANAIFARVFGDDSDEPLALHAVESIDAGVARLAPGKFKAFVDGTPREATGHVFLLGYPRSGTTLTEQILNTIPDVVSLEEVPTLAASEKYLSADGIEKLAALSDDDVMQLRRSYWAVVAENGVSVAGKMFVDMDPLKGAALPLIARIFPDAKVVIMHRDPPDVIWSCFKHNFVYSPTTYEFTSLSRAANHYHVTMSLIGRCLETLPLDAHILRYESLVRDFDETTRALCDFLGLPWSPDLLDFGKTARTHAVRTASGPQVRQALFDGTGQWRKYARHMESVLPSLEPWIEPFTTRKSKAAH